MNGIQLYQLRLYEMTQWVVIKYSTYIKLTMVISFSHCSCSTDLNRCMGIIVQAKQVLRAANVILLISAFEGK